MSIRKVDRWNENHIAVQYAQINTGTCAACRYCTMDEQVRDLLARAKLLDGVDSITRQQNCRTRF